MRDLPSDLTLPTDLAKGAAPVQSGAPRDASSVVLIRESSAGPEVYLLRRVRGMAFAGGMTAFPGGGVDRRDAEGDPPWIGPSPRIWARRFDVSVGLARALVCAAIRETFEECGVLLAGTGADNVLSNTTSLADARRALATGRVSMAQFLADTELALRADLLRPWANWLTPEGQPRRFDTRFFLAELPAGQQADGLTTEADDAGWCRPGDAIEDWRAGRRGLLPPTWMTLTELAEFSTVAEAMAAPRTIKKIMPTVVRDGDVLRAVLPEESALPSVDEPDGQAGAPA